MSLLLQALQKAAKNREGAGAEEPGKDAAAAEPDPPPVEPVLGAERLEQSPGGDFDELSLSDEEDLFGPDTPDPAPREPTLGGSEDRATAGGAARASRGRDALAPVHAATILRANESKAPGLIDRIRDRPVHAFAIAAAIFGVFYGAYLYLAIFHPAVLRGDFGFARKPPLQAKNPPPPARPITPPEAAPAPAATALAAAPAADAVQPPASAGVAPTRPAASSPPPPTTRAPSRSAGEEDMLAEATDGGDELSEAAPRKAARKPRSNRRAAAEVENVTLDDAVAVRTPEPLPSATAGQLTRAWEALQDGRYEEAAALYHEVARLEPDNIDAMLGVGAIAVHRGNAEQGVRAYGRALELDPRNAAAQAGLISIIGQADPQLSESRLKQLLAQEPSGFVYFALGNLYAKQVAWPQAQQAYFQAYQLQPDNPDYAYNLAVSLEHLGQSKIALNYYRRAIELRSLRGRAAFDSARVEERIGQLAARIGSK